MAWRVSVDRSLGPISHHRLLARPMLRLGHKLVLIHATPVTSHRLLLHLFRPMLEGRETVLVHEATPPRRVATPLTDPRRPRLSLGRTPLPLPKQLIRPPGQLNHPIPPLPCAPVRHGAQRAHVPLQSTDQVGKPTRGDECLGGVG
jgi:hypothetical protein